MQMTQKMVSYTNHTILSEALETWHVGLMKSVQPRIYMIIEEINRRFIDLMMDDPNVDNSIVQKAVIIETIMFIWQGLPCLAAILSTGLRSYIPIYLKTRVMKPYL